MSYFVVLILMFFAHIVDDYYLQGILAKMKQKKWWEENAQEPLYRYDYIIALICHAFSWSVMILLPIFFASAWNPHWVCYIMLGVNVVIHAIVDDLKANKKKISLVTDQIFHLAQISLTWAIWILWTVL